MKAILLMNESEIGCPIVIRRQKTVGNNNRALWKVVAKSKTPKKIKIREVMAKPLMSRYLAISARDCFKGLVSA